VALSNKVCREEAVFSVNCEFLRYSLALGILFVFLLGSNVIYRLLSSQRNCVEQLLNKKEDPQDPDAHIIFHPKGAHGTKVPETVVTQERVIVTSKGGQIVRVNLAAERAYATYCPNLPLIARASILKEYIRNFLEDRINVRRLFSIFDLFYGDFQIVHTNGGISSRKG